VAPSDRDSGRTLERAPIELAVEYRRLKTFFADYTKNISRGGTFIATERPLPVGTEFMFSLSVPNMTLPIKLRGKVMWTTEAREASDANPAGMGIEFQYSSPDERAEKEALIERLFVSEFGERLARKILGRLPGE
jgi:type IV pilus assembly protein PilZ